VIADPRDVLLAPVISEKSYGLLDENKYTFLVRPDANKTQIKIAVEQVFNVRVLDVNHADPVSLIQFEQVILTKKAMARFEEILK